MGDNRVGIIFANCAGGARGESCNPGKLGELLASQVKSGKYGDIFAIGLSEVILSEGDAKKYVPLCMPPGSARDISLNEDRAVIADLEEFAGGFSRIDKTIRFQKFYLSHLNSRDHCHPLAIEKKWRGETAPQRLREQFTLSRHVYQGTAALLNCPGVTSGRGIQLRPSGLDPAGGESDNPLEYHGNRDTEPRSAIIFYGLELAPKLKVNLAFCQLEANSADPRTGTSDRLENSLGTAHRIRQIDRLCAALSNGSPEFAGAGNRENPVILMGDFNARPGTKELKHLCHEHGFHHVLPENIPPHMVDRLDYNRKEIHQDPPWPYSHLGHQILIDHAFVRGFSPAWGIKLAILELEDEDNRKKRVSDHRPILLTLCLP